MSVVYLDDHRYPGPHSHQASEEITGLPTQAELDAYPRMFTWGDLKEIIVAGRLEGLMRNKQMQARYNTWTRGIKQKYGSIEKYLTQGRLPFPHTTPSSAPVPTYDPKTLDGGLSSPTSPDPAPHQASAPEYLRYDPAGLDPERYAVLPNDWPYNVPYGVRHFCVWSRVPITHPILVDNNVDQWAKIEEQGLGGFTGIIPVSAPARPDLDPSCLTSISQADMINVDTSASTTTLTGMAISDKPAHPLGWGATTVEGFGQGVRSWYEVDLKFGGPEFRKWAGVQYESPGGQEVGKMVRGLWDERGWECLWFVNPPRLQSVPGLSHFHVFARRKTPEEIDASEQVWGTGQRAA